MIKVSVIIPVFNAEKYLEQTIEKLKNQTLKEIEIILVDDGSMDGSARLCDDLAKSDCRIKCIHTENKGVSSARNTGISAAKGEYIGFCDADDIPDERLYETLYNLAKENNSQISMVKYATVFEDGKVIDFDGTESLKIYNTQNEALADFLSGKLFSGVYTKLFRRDLCSQISFEEGRKVNEDKMFIFNALRLADRCCYKDVSLYTYIRREGSSSNSSFSKKQLDCIYFADKMQSIVENDFPEIIDYAKSNSVYSYLKVLKLMCLTGGELEYKKEFSEYTNYLRGFSVSFCKKYLKRNDFIKWLALNINKKLFRFIVKKYCRT